MKKQTDATAKVPIRILFAGRVTDVPVMLLYNMDPSIMEHMRIAKMRPNGRSVWESASVYTECRKRPYHLPSLLACVTI
jgi:hypothetical protein